MTAKKNSQPRASFTPSAPARAPSPPASPVPAEAAKAPASRRAARPAKAVVAVAPEQSRGKPKLVRDSFTIPKTEYARLEGLKQRAAKLARPTKKSELLRAGIAVLAGMGDKAFLAALEGVPSLKTGRPKADTPSPE